MLRALLNIYEFLKKNLFRSSSSLLHKINVEGGCVKGKERAVFMRMLTDAETRGQATL